ncbi:MAG: hypothetical protein A2W25_08410 [candidate division Zixibacteria bacterium RBG_16_53_22]|nr:MAG: hypothetical protein A2W25_08410 [candidate division Zixibacteria bacterium RBG_16_53_22]
MRKAVVGLILVAFLGPAAWADWSGLAGDQLVSYFPGPSDFLSTSNRIVAGPNGLLYAVWAQGRSLVPYELYFGKSTDNGRTWSSSTADQRISASDGESVFNPLDRGVGLALTGQGHICVVWAESLTNVGNEIMFIKSTDGGDTWINTGADFPLSDPGGLRPSLPKIAADNNNNLHVVWQQSNGSNAEIHYGFSSDDGDTWTSQTADRIISFPDGNAAQQAEIAIDNSDNVYVVWMERNETDTNTVHFGKKLAGETQFSSETADFPITLPHAGSTWEPSIAVAPDGSMHVVWEARNNAKGAMYYSRSTDGGTTWSGLDAEQNVDYDAYDDSSSTDAAIVATSQGHLAVSYTNWRPDLSGARTRVSLSTDGGNTWSGNVAAELIDHFEGGDTRPAYGAHICVSTGDTLHVIWHEDCMDLGGSSGYYEIMYSRGDVLGVAPPSPGTISGVVHETDNTTPIADVLVETYDVFNTLMASDTTDAGGTYQVTLDPGTYREHFVKEGYDAVDLSGIVVASDSITIVSVTMSPLSGCVYIPGDINSNGFANGIDVTYGVAFLKGGTPPPDTCFDCPSLGQDLMAAGDVNGSCGFNGIDITFFVAYLKQLQPALLFCPSCPPATRGD